MKKHLLPLIALLLTITSCKEQLCDNGIYPFCDESYTPVAPGTFTEKALCPSGGSPVCFAIAGKGYMGTGSVRFPPSDGGTNRFYAYNPFTDVWDSIASMPVNGRLNAVAFATGWKGYVGGGATVVGSGELGSIFGDLKDFWQYDAEQDTWVQKADLPGGGGSYIGMSILDKGYVAKQNKFWEYNPQTNTWRQKAACPVAYGVMFSIGPLGYIVGEGKLWEYNILDNQWKTRTDFPGGQASTAFATTTKGYVLSNDAIWEYNPINNKWYERGGIPVIGKEEVQPPTGLVLQPAFEVGDKGYFGIAYRGYSENFFEFDPYK